MKLNLLILAFLTAGFAHGQNLIQNGSFEQFTSTIPNLWTITNGTAAQETTVTNNGSSSLKGFPSSPNLSTSPYFWISQDFTLSNTESYTLKFDYFVPGTTSTNNISGIGFEIRLNDSDKAYYFAKAYPSTTPVFGVWETVTYELKIALFKSSFTSAGLNLTLQARADYGFANTYAYFDNVIIVKTSSLGTVDFNKKSNPIAFVSKEEIKLNSEYQDSSYVIYSMEGKAVKRVTKNSSNSIGISELPKGVYLLKLNDMNSSVKFIKQ